MKYNKLLIIDNINYLVKYNYEPEITIILNNNQEIFLIAYQEFIEITLPNNETVKLSKIDELFNYIDVIDIKNINGSIDFLFPVQKQSVIIDNELWIDALLPSDVFKKYNKQVWKFILFTAIYFSLLIVGFLIVVTKADSFDLSVIIAVSVFILSVLCLALCNKFFDKKRKKIIENYYGCVNEKDKITAVNLLSKINLVHNDYDIYKVFHFDDYDLSKALQYCLKSIIKGKKVYIGMSACIHAVLEEIKNNNNDNKYCDQVFNDYIKECSILIERNNVVI